MIDLRTRQHVHLVGIGGAGMSAIATVLAAMGHEVTGSDLKASSTLDRLGALGLRVVVGHNASNVAGASMLAISTAVPESNPEVQAARRRGIPVHSRADVLAEIAAGRRLVAVAGTHGKTTTASMLSLILREAGMRPSFIIGGDVNDVETNALWDEGPLLVVEADESDGTFLRLRPEVAVVTSVEPDHLEHYGSYEALEAAFRTFMGGAEHTVVAADDRAAALAPGTAHGFGQTEQARFRLGPVASGRSSSRFHLFDGATDLGTFELAVPGEHNARNAAAAVGAALVLGARPGAAKRALARYAGVARRFEFRGEGGGVTFVDDYAHLPSEVKAALAAARGGGFERIVAVFQPHRYSRIAALAADFGGAFSDADVVIVTDVYAAGEAPRPGVTGALVAEAVRAADAGREVRYTASHEELIACLRQELRAGDCCITMQAGDLSGLADELLREATR
ncbi:MAG: UDP-N-acetylmuramate--L-alanine ligase [Acidimicrobiales bacterium]